MKKTKIVLLVIVGIIFLTGVNTGIVAYYASGEYIESYEKFNMYEIFHTSAGMWEMPFDSGLDTLIIRNIVFQLSLLAMIYFSLKITQKNYTKVCLFFIGVFFAQVAVLYIMRIAHIWWYYNGSFFRPEHFKETFKFTFQNLLFQLAITAIVLSWTRKTYYLCLSALFLFLGVWLQYLDYGTTGINIAYDYIASLCGRMEIVLIILIPMLVRPMIASIKKIQLMHNHPITFLDI